MSISCTNTKPEQPTIYGRWKIANPPEMIESVSDDLVIEYKPDGIIILEFEGMAMETYLFTIKEKNGINYIEMASKVNDEKYSGIYRLSEDGNTLTVKLFDPRSGLKIPDNFNKEDGYQLDNFKRLTKQEE